VEGSLYARHLPASGTKQGEDMKKRLVILVIGLAVMMMSPGRGTLRADGFSTHYTVTCIESNRLNRCGCTVGQVMGEWDRACDGTLTGWGDLPYSNNACESTDEGADYFCG
jgi:hypothetical protein